MAYGTGKEGRREPCGTDSKLAWTMGGWAYQALRHEQSAKFPPHSSGTVFWGRLFAWRSDRCEKGMCHCFRASQQERLRFAGGSEAGDKAGEKSQTANRSRSEEHTSELQSRGHLVCR